MSRRTFLIKLPADSCPGRNGFPKIDAEWEGAEFTFPTGRSVKEYPSPGDQAYIWIHEKPRAPKLPGAGLRGRVTVRSVRGNSSFIASDAKLFRAPVRSDQLMGDGPLIKDIRHFAHDRSSVLTPSDVAELDAEIVAKEQKLLDFPNTLPPKTSSGTGFDGTTLEAPDYSLILQEHGFAETKRTQKTIEFAHPELDTPVYLKLSPSGEYVKETPIVIHPGLATALSSAASSSEGWWIENIFYHMSNMTAFPTRLHGGEGETHYGTAIRISSRSAFASFIATLLRKERENDEGLDSSALAALPQTERMALTKARRGQGKYRYDLLALWGNCSVTGVDEPLALTAAHIKRWSDSSPTEKLDPYNGFLLTPNLDRLFEHGLITFLDDGKMEISSALSSATLNNLGLNPEMRLRHVFPQNRKYLAWHRQHRFKAGPTPR